MRIESLANVPVPETVPAVLLIAFCRPDFVKQLLDALQHQTVQPEVLYVSIDGPRNAQDEEAIQKVLDVVEQYRKHFTIHLKQHTQNLGCVKHCISAISETFTQEEQLIIIEDDIFPNRYFVEKMSQLLSVYANKPKVFAIHGYDNISNEAIGVDTDFHFTPRFYCWGWASWRNRWQQVEPIYAREIKDRNPYKSFFKIPVNQKTPYLFQIQYLMDRGLTYEWSISLGLNTLKSNLLCLSPRYAMTQNVGNYDARANSVFYKDADINPLFREDYNLLTLPAEIKSPEILSRHLNPRAHFLFHLRRLHWYLAVYFISLIPDKAKAKRVYQNYLWTVLAIRNKLKAIIG